MERSLNLGIKRMIFMTQHNSTGNKRSHIEAYRSRLDHAKDFGDVFEVVKDTVKRSIGGYRVGLMLVLDDLPLQVGAYHPVGSNTIVMNRLFLQIVQATASSKQVVNSFIYTILLHEYLHALGFLPESDVRPLVYRISMQCFGQDHLATRLAEVGPWALLKDVPVNVIEAPKRVAEIVKNFEGTNQRYIS
jgi:hypothetical protein